MFSFLRRRPVEATELVTSQLFDQNTFYREFASNLNSCIYEAIIESPFITSSRAESLLPIFKKMRSRQVRVIVNTRDPSEHDAPYDTQAWGAIRKMQDIGVEVLFTGGHHRKLAILDREVIWEGSLNILSQNSSCEIMRKITSKALADEMVSFLRIEKHFN